MFIDALLLEAVSFGFQTSMLIDKTIVRMRNGSTRRILRSTRPRFNFSAPYEAITGADRAVIAAAFAAAGAASFRFRDLTNYQIVGQQIATGTGAPQQVQLFQRLTFGGTVMDRPITKPAGHAVLDSGGAIASTTDTLTGIVSFTAPVGIAVTATVDFDVPVFFSEQSVDFSRVQFDADTGEILLEEDIDA